MFFKDDDFIELDIKVKKCSKVYHEGDVISGVVVFQCKNDVKHDGIDLTVEGLVNLQLSSKNVGIFEAFYNSVKPINLVSSVLEIASAGKMPAGKTEIPFEAPLQACANRRLYETYHGVFINIQYNLHCDLKRNFLHKDHGRTLEIMVEYRKQPGLPAAPKKDTSVNFTITPESLQNVNDRSRVPRFLVTGRLDATVCEISKPFTGEVSLLLYRREGVFCRRELTEIQTIQIGEGNIVRGLAIPVYMIFPRMFTCPTLTTSNFKVEFEVNIVIIFGDEHIITENFPITLVR
ncbi:vacuolar protein sorting-associated protein 26C [Nilaparvata lugens]|uniref:vacuolar protein sorting-associated protein 26C n=1 Tax=Nilaparvata lugens TaxID=108931 RepID=UPI00193EBB8A|nr:vacuolar protein sorting-associated protein 26C [Nilaparvata lugens]